MFFKRRKKVIINWYAIAVFSVLGVFALVIIPSTNDSVLFKYPNKKKVVISTPQQFFLPPNPDREIIKIAGPKTDIVVPFVTQAPLGEWNDPRQQDGCEEASVLMAMSWINKEELDLNKAKTLILDMAEWQKVHYQSYVDTSAEDTMLRLLKHYYQHENTWLVENVTIDKIIHQLSQGHLLILPMNGRLLNNPFFTPPGPERHMILVRGYDQESKELITNDPGTRRGEAYRYPYDTFIKAIRDYPSGDHQPMTEEKKNMIVVAMSN